MTTRENRILRKLLELARRGEAGERENADKLLDRLCAKHGVNRADLERADLPLRRVRYRFRDEHERSLAVQVASMVLDKNAVTTLTTGRARTWQEIDLPVAQAVEFEAMFTAYQSAWREEQHALLYAFITKNRIFPATAEPGSTAPDEAELRRWRKARNMAPGVDVVAVRKQLESGPEKSV